MAKVAWIGATPQPEDYVKDDIAFVRKQGDAVEYHQVANQHQANALDLSGYNVAVLNNVSGLKAQDAAAVEPFLNKVVASSVSVVGYDGDLRNVQESLQQKFPTAELRDPLLTEAADLSSAIFRASEKGPFSAAALEEKRTQQGPRTRAVAGKTDRR